MQMALGFELAPQLLASNGSAWWSYLLY